MQITPLQETGQSQARCGAGCGGLGGTNDVCLQSLESLSQGRDFQLDAEVRVGHCMATAHTEGPVFRILFHCQVGSQTHLERQMCSSTSINTFNIKTFTDLSIAEKILGREDTLLKMQIVAVWGVTMNS